MLDDVSGPPRRRGLAAANAAFTALLFLEVTERDLLDGCSVDLAGSNSSFASAFCFEGEDLEAGDGLGLLRRIILLEEYLL